MSDDRKLGEILIQNGWLSREDLESALRVQATDGRIIGNILLEMKAVSKPDLYRGLAIQYDYAFVDISEIHVTDEAIKLIPKRFAHANCCMPLFTRGEYFLVAIGNPQDAWVEGEVRKIVTGFKVRCGIATPEDITAALLKYYGSEGS